MTTVAAENSISKTEAGIFEAATNDTEKMPSPKRDTKRAERSSPSSFENTVADIMNDIVLIGASFRPSNNAYPFFSFLINRSGLSLSVSSRDFSCLHFSIFA